MNSANKIFAEISVGELLDKISILEIKQKNIKDEQKIKIISKELESLNYSLKKDVRITDEIKSLYEDLKKINIKLWNIEDGKRDCERNGDFGEKFIQLARSVYIENDQRAKIKNKINKISGSNISEVKRPELNAALVGMNICQQLKKKISYRRVINKAMQATMRMGANGIRINVAGRLGGVEIARSEKYSDGSVPLHTCYFKVNRIILDGLSLVDYFVELLLKLLVIGLPVLIELLESLENNMLLIIPLIKNIEFEPNIRLICLSSVQLI